MKNLILITVLMFAVTSCSSVKDLFNSGKEAAAKSVAKVAQENAVKHLKCSTGYAVHNDVEAQIKKALRVKSTEAKSVAGTVCTLAVEPVMAKIFEAGNKKLPYTWIEDGCSLDGFADDAKEAASKLCSKL